MFLVGYRVHNWYPLRAFPGSPATLSRAWATASWSGMTHRWLVVWNMTFMTCHVLGIVIPTDFHIFQRGRSTTNQYWYWYSGCVFRLRAVSHVKLGLVSMSKAGSPQVREPSSTVVETGRRATDLNVSNRSPFKGRCMIRLIGSVFQEIVLLQSRVVSTNQWYPDGLKAVVHYSIHCSEMQACLQKLKYVSKVQMDGSSTVLMDVP